MSARKSRAIALHARRYLGNYVRANILGRQHILPYFALYYATHRCNAGCLFCSREKEVLGAAVKEKMDLARTRVVLAQVRRLVPTLYVSGGEPLTLPDIEERLKIARELEFYTLLMNTNAILLHRHWGVLEILDTLVVSLHTINPAKLAETYQVKLAAAEQAIENIKEAARRARIRGNAKVMANCVLTADNISGADDVLDFCLKHGIELAVVPAVVGQKPMIESANPEQRAAYVRFLNRVIEQKKKSRRTIQGTIGYLECIRDLRAFECRPDGMLPISPDGHLVYACDDDYRELLGRVDENTTVLSILKNASDFRAPFQACGHKCLKACYAQTAALLQEPLEVLCEYLSRR